MFDLAAGVWVKPSAHTKQRKEQRVPLSAAAVELLSTIRTWGLEGPFVFPAPDGRPITDIKRTWISVCCKAGLATKIEKRTRGGKLVKTDKGEPVLVWKTTARLHDLRHTYASILASNNLSLPVIGALLGHTQAQTTARYAHLADDPLQEATNRVDALLTALATERTAEVASLRK